MKWIVCVAVAGLCVTGWAWAKDEPRSTAVIDPAPVLASLQHAVSSDAWNINASHVEVSVLNELFDTRARAGAELQATLPTGLNALSIRVLDHASPADALGYLKASRAAQATSLPSGPEVKTLAKAERGGKGGSRPGYFSQLEFEANNATLNLTLHGVAFRTLTIEISVANLPQCDRSTQDTYLEYAIARIESPNTKHVAPAPLSVGHGARAVTISVTDALGEPIASAQMFLLHAVHGVLTRSDCINGTCSLSVSNEPVTIVVMQATGEDGARLNLARTDTVLDADATELRIRMRKGLRITGRVLQPNGEPLEGARVSATPLGINATVLDTIALDSNAPTDHEGHFDIPALLAGEYFLSVTREAGSVDTNGPEQVQAGDRDVVLRIKRRGVLRIRALDSEGTPVADAKVWGTATEYAMFLAMQRDDFVLTDANGDAEIDVSNSARSYAVMLMPPKNRLTLACTTVQLDASKTPQAVRILTFETGWTLQLRVVDAQGAPVSARVSLQQIRWGGTERRTDADGLLTIAHLPHTAIKLHATTPPHLYSHSDEPPFQTIEPAKTVVTVTAHAYRPLRVVVLDAEGAPVPRAIVTLVKTTSTEGAEIVALPHDVASPNVPFDVQVTNARDNVDRLLHLAPNSVTISDTSQTSVTIRLKPGAPITGRIVDAAGQAVSDVRVTIRQAKRTSLDYSVTRSDASGAFSFIGRDGVTYRIRAQDEQRSAATTVQVGKTSTVLLTLEAK